MYEFNTDELLAVRDMFEPFSNAIKFGGKADPLDVEESFIAGEMINAGSADLGGSTSATVLTLNKTLDGERSASANEEFVMTDRNGKIIYSSTNQQPRS